MVMVMAIAVLAVGLAVLCLDIARLDRRVRSQEYRIDTLERAAREEPCQLCGKVGGAKQFHYCPYEAQA